MGRKNLICVDDSKFSKHAFEWYLKNFHREDDVLYLIHVFQTPTVPFSATSGKAVFDDDYKKAVEDSVGEVRILKAKYEHLCNEKNVKHEFSVEDSCSSPGHKICDFAKTKDIDSIFMGQRGLSTISRTLLGSVSDYVLHHADVPVIVIPIKSKASE